MKNTPSEFDDAIGLGEIDDDPLGEPEMPALPWERPGYDPRPNRTADDLIRTVELAELRKDVLGEDVDELPKAVAPTLTLAQRTAQTVQKAVAQIYPKVEFINANAPARKARIAGIIDKAKAALKAKGYATDGDGWKSLAKRADEYVVSVLLEA